MSYKIRINCVFHWKGGLFDNETRMCSWSALFKAKSTVCQVTRVIFKLSENMSVGAKYFRDLLYDFGL